MWLGDVTISQVEALNMGFYGVFPIFVSKVMAENVNNLKLFSITSILFFFLASDINSISVSNMFKVN